MMNSKIRLTVTNKIMLFGLYLALLVMSMGAAPLNDSIVHLGVVARAPKPHIAPKLVSPGSGSTLKNYFPTFKWKRSKLPSLGYQIQISDTKDFSNIILEEVTEATAYSMITELPTAGTYFWRVRTYYGEEAVPQYSNWTKTKKFKTRAMVTGVVRDGFNGMPLANVTVQVKGSNLSALTDDQGQYFIKGLPSKKLTFITSGGGYYAKSQKLKVSNARNYQLDISLIPTNQNNPYIQLAWFYHPPAQGNYGLVSERSDTIILGSGDTGYRDQLRSTGNNYLIVVYLTFNSIYKPASCSDEPWHNQVAYRCGDYCEISQQHPDWFLLDAQGRQIIEDYGNGTGFVYMDPANPGWQAFWLERARNIVEQGWDGVFMDNLDGSIGRFAKLGQVPAAYPDNASLTTAYTEFLSYVYNGYFKPNNLKLLANYTENGLDINEWIQYLDNLDGVMEEGFGVDWGDGYRSSNAWEAQLSIVEQVQAMGKHVILVSQGSKTAQARQKFAFASYLLVSDGMASFRYSHYNWYDQAWWYDDYDTPLGYALGPRYLSGGNWVRDFSNGRVTVNPTTHQVKFSVNQ